MNCFYTWILLKSAYLYCKVEFIVHAGLVYHGLELLILLLQSLLKMVVKKFFPVGFQKIPMILPSKLIEWSERLLIHKLQIRIILITKVQQDIFLLELSGNGKVCRKVVLWWVFFMSETSEKITIQLCVSKSPFRA